MNRLLADHVARPKLPLPGIVTGQCPCGRLTTRRNPQGGFCCGWCVEAVPAAIDPFDREDTERQAQPPAHMGDESAPYDVFELRGCALRLSCPEVEHDRMLLDPARLEAETSPPKAQVYHGKITGWHRDCLRCKNTLFQPAKEEDRP